MDLGTIIIIITLVAMYFLYKNNTEGYLTGGVIVNNGISDPHIIGSPDGRIMDEIDGDSQSQYPI